ncbi:MULTISPECIES: histone-like nucleoid-structuring protein, MvaT/MvaU family [unclassified Pseudomonas]|uniref:histone-like nucleoid-structuring protein, MvaT/MvaU family n=1 Tax=unclassified Pseudomonas TaxID=196821 RepID=UPI00390621B7
MSKLAEFRALERHLAEQLQALEAMKNDKGLEREIEFEQKLRKLLGEHDKSLRDVIAILDPQASKISTAQLKSIQPASTRKPRMLKTYKNPHTGEVIETKGGNHRKLKEWKAEHGAATVESWLS